MASARFLIASVLIGAAWHCAPVHTPPAVDTPLPAANVAVAAPEAASSPSPAPPAPPALPSGRTVYGFLGQRGIVGTLAAAGGEWSGSFRFLDAKDGIPLSGTAWLGEDAGPPEEPVLDGRTVHTFFDCQFSTGGTLSGTVTEATCLDEPGVLEIDGEWSAGSRAEPFYLRTPAPTAIDPSEYYAALMATPSPSHACPPFVDLLQSEAHPTGRTTLLYLLTWPCDRGRTESSFPTLVPDRHPKPAPPSHEAYLADVASDVPGPLLWSSSCSALPDPDESNEITQNLASLELAPGLGLYIANLRDTFQSPVSSGGNQSETLEIWAVSTQGRYGPKLSLTVGEAGHAGWCFSSSASSEAWLMDFDADKIPELVVRTTTNERHDSVANGQSVCVDAPSRSVLTAYRLNPQTLAWQPLKPVPRVSEARLASARRLEF